jgi:hypothetical protein
MTAAQRRLLDEIVRQGGADENGAELRDAGSARSLALRNINRDELIRIVSAVQADATVEALVRAGAITIGDDGCFHVTERAE